MINYETILSNFDDKVTLYNWLRKVEEALKNASLESVSVEQQSAGTAILTFIFADGTSVVSPALTLPQGPTGPQGATGVSIDDVSLNENNAFVVKLDNGETITTDTISASRLYCHSIDLSTYGPSVNVVGISLELINDNGIAYTTPMEIFNAYKDSNNYTPFFQVSGALYDATSQTYKDVYRARLHLVNDVLHLEANVTGEVQPTLDVLVFPSVIDQCIKLSLAVAKGDTGPQGETGNGIENIVLISSLGLVNTYRINFTDGTHFDFDVTNGSSFVNVDGHDIAPAKVNATGNITAPSIIENMSGYSAHAYASFNQRYLGACKNGNKLTFAVAGALTTASTHPSGGAYQAVSFTIPTSIANKIIPYTGSLVALNSVDMAINTYSTPVRGSYQFIKEGNTFYVYFLVTNLAVSTTYNVRFDITFLLSDNLAQ